VSRKARKAPQKGSSRKAPHQKGLKRWVSRKVHTERFTERFKKMGVQKGSQKDSRKAHPERLRPAITSSNNRGGCVSFYSVG
jgi:hypothetical protein